MGATLVAAPDKKRYARKVGRQQRLIDPRSRGTPDIADVHTQLVLVLGDQFDEEFLESFALATQHALQHQFGGIVPIAGRDHAVGNVHEIRR